MAGRRAQSRPASSRTAATVVAPAPEPDTSVPDGLLLAKREQLERILASETFRHADGLKRFLTFIVNEAIANRQDLLKEYVIGVQVFRKESFDPRTDPIVRVQARRLRAKLVRYYRDESRTDALTIELPKGGYAPVFKPREAEVLLKPSVKTMLVSRNTIAVLRLLDHSADGQLGYLCDAIRDEIVHRLAQSPGLRIMASRTGGAPEETDEVARNAAVLIGGNVRRSGDQVRISVHLIDSTTGCYLWSESIDVEHPDTFTAQEKVTEAVLRCLEPELIEERRTSTFSGPVDNLAAKNLCLQGRYYLSQRTEEGLRKAVDFFEKALVEGEQYAPAHSGLADAYGLLTHYGVLAPTEVWTKAAAHAGAAVMLDDRSAEAHTSLAHVKATQDWDWTGAEREFQRAIRLNPNLATAHHWYASSCLAPLGRLDEALDEILTAQALDPVSAIVARDVAVIHFYRRDFETGLEQCDYTIELSPHFAPAYWILGLIQEQRHEFDEAVAAFQRALHLSPRTPRVHGALGRTLALSGKKQRANEVLRVLERSAKVRYVSPLEFAWIHLALGSANVGYRWLEKACKDRSFDLTGIKVDPRFDPYRDDKRFKELLRQVDVD